MEAVFWAFYPLNHRKDAFLEGFSGTRINMGP